MTVSRRILKGYLAGETGRSEFKLGVVPELLYMVMPNKGICHVISDFVGGECGYKGGCMITSGCWRSARSAKAGGVWYVSLAVRQQTR